MYASGILTIILLATGQLVAAMPAPIAADVAEAHYTHHKHPEPYKTHTWHHSMETGSKKMEPTETKKWHHHKPTETMKSKPTMKPWKRDDAAAADEADEDFKKHHHKSHEKPYPPMSKKPFPTESKGMYHHHKPTDTKKMPEPKPTEKPYKRDDATDAAESDEDFWKHHHKSHEKPYPTESKKPFPTESKKPFPTESKKPFPTESKKPFPTESKSMYYHHKPTESKKMPEPKPTEKPYGPY